MFIEKKILQLFLLSLVFIFHFMTAANASESSDFTTFSNNLDTVFVGKLIVKWKVAEGEEIYDSGPPLIAEEIDKIFQDVIQTEFADKLNIPVISKEEFLKAMNDKTASLPSNVLSISGMLSIFSPDDLEEKFGVLIIHYSKPDEYHPLRGMYRTYGAEYQPAFFKFKNDKSSFQEQIREVLFAKIGELLPKIFCRGSTHKFGNCTEFESLFNPKNISGLPDPL